MLMVLAQQVLQLAVFLLRFQLLPRLLSILLLLVVGAVGKTVLLAEAALVAF
jgi:hypothetical protein